MQYIRSFLFLMVFCVIGPAVNAQDIIQLVPDNDGRNPGDKGYMHEETHPFYQTLFGKGKCNCHSGECRPTMWRSNASSPSGYQVVHNDVWIDVPPEAIQNREDVPEQLWQYPAHICAFPSATNPNIIVVECAIINSTS